MPITTTTDVIIKPQNFGFVGVGDSNTLAWIKINTTTMFMPFNTAWLKNVMDEFGGGTKVF